MGGQVAAASQDVPGRAGAAPRRLGLTTTDARTLELTLAVARRLQAALGAGPSLVVARFSREFVDANRAETESFEMPAARPVHEACHRRIREQVEDIRRR